ncbi:hypothetical protein ABID70_002580 [Clavibacter michiganensis]
MPVEHGLEPGEQRAVVLEEPGADGRRVEIRAGSGRHVVVQLEEPDAEPVDEPVDGLVEVGAGIRRAQVEQVPGVLDDADAAALQERGVGQGARRAALEPHDLRFEPEAGDHALRADAIEHGGQAGREPRGRGLPVADARPPPGRVVVPAGVDAEHLGADARGGVDEGQELPLGRVALERVHVVVEDDGQRVARGVRTAGGAALGGEAPQRVVEGSGHREGDGHGREGRVAVERHRPLVQRVRRPEDGDVRAVARAVRPRRSEGGLAEEPVLERDAAVAPVRILAELERPGAVVLDLPRERPAGAAVARGARGVRDARRPRAEAGDREPVPAGLAAGRAVDGDEPGGAQRAGGPPVLRAPAAVGPPQVDVVGRVGHDRARGEAGDGPHAEGRVPGLDPERRRGAHGRHARDRLEHGGRDEAGRLVALHDLQPVDAARGGRGRVDEPQPGAERGAVVAVAVVDAAPGRREHLDERLARRAASGSGGLGRGVALGSVDGDEAHRTVRVVLEREAQAAGLPSDRGGHGGVDDGHEGSVALRRAGVESDPSPARHPNESVSIRYHPVTSSHCADMGPRSH